MRDLPWLDYDGQTTQDLLNLAATHRIDSINCAFGEALLDKDPTGAALHPDEVVVAAIEALQREVNNGGFHQFFTNASSQYAPVIADCLRRVGADEESLIAANAIAALDLDRVTPEAVREAAHQAIVRDDVELLDLLDHCDQQYYGIQGLDEKLFAFVEANAANINVP